MTSDLLRFQNAYEIFRVWTLIAVLGGIIGIGLSIYGYSAKKRIKYFGIGLVGHMFLCGLIFSLLNNIFLNRAKQQLVDILSDSSLTVKICNINIPVADQKVYLSEIVLLRDIPRHHSQPLDTIPIEILQDKNNLGLRIQRDSDRANEYWIYWNRYKISSENAIGFIQTGTFDKINCH
jgi:hypothetical protein